MEIVEIGRELQEPLLCRVPEAGTLSVTTADRVVVEAGRQAVVVAPDGAVLAMLGAGHHPVLEGGEGETREVAVVFAATEPSRRLLWGTAQPLELVEPAVGAVPVRAWGWGRVRLRRPEVWGAELVGRRGIHSTLAFEDLWRPLVVAALERLLEARFPSPEAVARASAELARTLELAVAAALEPQGVELVELCLGGFTATRRLERQLRRRLGRPLYTPPGDPTGWSG